MGAIQDRIDDGSLVLWHDYRSGHADDLSGQGNDGVAAGVVWNREGARFRPGDEITVADAAELQLTDCTLMVLSNFMSQASTEAAIYKRDAGGTNYDLSLTSGNVALYDGSNTRNLATDITGNKMVAVSVASGGTGIVYVDGVSAGNLDGVSAITADDAPLLIGNAHGGAAQFQSTLSAALIFNRVLTPTEHAAVYAELAGMRWPQKQSRGEAHYMGRELLVDGDMADPGVSAWIAWLNANLSKVAGALRIARDGTNNPYAQQVVLSIGKRYRVIGTVSSDGVATPKVYCGQSAGTWMGVNTTTAPQAFDVVVTADTSSFLFQTVTTVGTAYCDFHPLEVRELISDRRTEWDDRRDGTLLWGTDWGTPVTEDRTAGQRVGPFEIISGTHKVVTDTIEGVTVKAIENVVAGRVAITSALMRMLPSDAAYGTVEFWANKAAASTLTAYFVAATDAGGAGYHLDIEADESISVTETGVAEKFSTAAAAVTVGEWHRIRITRSAAGVFTMYLDGVLMVAASGTNPFTDTTTAVSNYLVFDLDAGDKIALADVGGSHAINKFQGVVVP